VIAPDVEFWRLTTADPLRMAYLVMDKHGAHNTPDNVREMQKLGIPAIWLPPHSSHFLQLLDLTVFGAFKKA
jgi:hypothetical protein